MLKQTHYDWEAIYIRSAAFGRLRVETRFARLVHSETLNQLPSGGCVLKHTKIMLAGDVDYLSRLRAAAC